MPTGLVVGRFVDELGEIRKIGFRGWRAHRCRDGLVWTDHVSRNGEAVVDPLV